MRNSIIYHTASLWKFLFYFLNHFRYYYDCQLCQTINICSNYKVIFCGTTNKTNSKIIFKNQGFIVEFVNIRLFWILPFVQYHYTTLVLMWYNGLQLFNTQFIIFYYVYSKYKRRKHVSITYYTSITFIIDTMSVYVQYCWELFSIRFVNFDTLLEKLDTISSLLCCVAITYLYTIYT